MQIGIGRIITNKTRKSEELVIEEKGKIYSLKLHLTWRFSLLNIDFFLEALEDTKETFT